MTFPERFQRLLNERELSTYKLAKESGLSEGLLGFWRRGDKIPRVDKLEILADYFNVSIDYLVGRTDNPEVNK